MKFHVMTLFPELIESAASTSIMGRAIESGLIEVNAVNIRDFSKDKNRRVDDYTYGGGAGMLMQAEPVYDCYRSLKLKSNTPVIYMTPVGEVFSQDKAEELSKYDELVFLCGHYEGIDERVLEESVTDFVSIGDYVLTGGELPAMVLTDCVARLIPGVLSNSESGEIESFSDGLLEYPQYTRPEVWRGKAVPEILLSGDHAKVEKWRYDMSLAETKKFRPDMYEKYMDDLRERHR